MPSREDHFNPDLPAASNYHWLPWLQKQLIVRGYAAHTPEMPNAWAPDYSIWQKEFERFDINSQTILVGHSCGGGFIVRWLSENKNLQVGKVVIIAPWLDPKRTNTTNFFDFQIDPNLASRTDGLTIFNSDDDEKDIQDSVDHIRKTVINLKYQQFHKYGHFCITDMSTSEFPELIETLFGQ